MEQAEQSNQGKEFLTIQKISLHLGLKTSTPYAMVGEKKISHCKVGRLLRIYDHSNPKEEEELKCSKKQKGSSEC